MSETTTPPPADTRTDTSDPAPRKKRWWLRVLQWLGILLLVLFLFLQLPFVQQFLAQQAIQRIEKALGTPVSLERVRIKWFDELDLQNLYIADQKLDTLLQSGHLVADFNLNPFAIYKRGLEIEALTLEGAQFNIRRATTDTFSNIQWALLRLFPPKPYTGEVKKKKPIPFNLRELHLSDVHFTQIDSTKGSALDAYVTGGQIYLNGMDLGQPLIDISSLNLRKPIVRISKWWGYDATQANAPPPLDPALEENPTSMEEAIPELIDSLGVDIRIGELQLTGGQFELHNYRKEPVRALPSNQLDLKHLNLYDIQVEVDSLRLDKETYSGRVNWIAAKDRSGFQLERLSAKEAIVSPNEMTLNGLSIITPTSSLGDSLRFTYRSFADWEFFEDKVRMDARFHDADITLQDIIAFVPKLNDNTFFDNNRRTNLQIEGRIRGQVNNLRGNDLRVTLADGTVIDGSFSSQNLAVKQEEFLILELDELNTRVRTLRQLIPGFNPPANYDKLGRMRFSGSFVGFFVDFVADGQLQTDLGEAAMDMQMVLTGGARRARYSGNLNLTNFNLGGWTENPDFGLVDFRSEVVDGYGLTADVASARLNAAIDRITFKDYTYENATVTGELNKNFFNGDFAIQDENIDFGFTGEIDFRDSIPVFDFKANVNRLALQPLNLSPANLVLAGLVDLNLRNTEFSKMEGDVNLREIKLVKNDTEEFDINFMRAFTFFTPGGEKVFRLESDIARGEVRGEFDINELPTSLQLFMLRNYPGFAERLGFKEPKRIPDVNEFSFDLYVEDSKGLNFLVDPKLGILKDIDLSGRYNGTSDSLIFYLEMPSLTYGNLRLADVYVHMDALKNEGDLDIVVDSTIINGKPRLNTFTFLSILQSDTLDFAVNISTDTPNLFDQVNLNGIFFLPDSTDYGLQLRQSNLSLLQTPWVIDESNLIRFGQGEISAESFTLKNKNRRIHIRNNGTKGLRVQLANFNFNFLDEAWDYDPLNFSGDFDMLLQVDDIFKLEGVNAVMSCDDFYINDDNFGQFRLDAYTADLKSQANAIISLSKDSMQMEVEALYNLADIQNTSQRRQRLPVAQQKNYLDLKTRFSGFPMTIAEYWLGGGLRNTHGYFNADLQVKGLTSELDVGGFIDARDGGFTIQSLQTHYTFRQGMIRASNTLFDASGTVIYDKYGNSALVEGGITHDRLKSLGLNARMRTRRFLGLDLAKGDNNLFYGKAIGSGEVLFTGDFQRPNIYVNGTVSDSTHLIIPVTDEAERSDLNFVRFINRHQETQQQNTGNGNTKIKGLNLEMDIRVTEVADLEMIFDEKAGDILRGRGRGNLRILLPRAEDFQMYGDVTVTSGDYLFTLYDVINKDFRILPGGKISWNGDPLDAQVDIAASYKDLKTSLTTFIQEYLVNAPETEQKQAQQATDVDLILYLKGELFSPDISFDINFPNLQGILENLAASKLNLLRQEPNEMNKQVFGLIALGQFLPSDLSFNSGEVITNTLSEYFSNQLSLLLTDLFSGVIGDGRTISSLDVDVDYNRVTAADLSNSQTNFGDAVEINLRSGLFNERVSLDIGGNFEFGQTTQNGTFFGENIVLEYAISSNRDLKVRLYERRDQDIGGGRRLQVGTGLSWRKEFTSFGEFWRSLKGKK